MSSDSEDILVEIIEDSNYEPLFLKIKECLFNGPKTIQDLSFLLEKSYKELSDCLEYAISRNKIQSYKKTHKLLGEKVYTLM
jgi:hypothetical protein